jgi:hypothetical protein
VSARPCARLLAAAWALLACAGAPAPSALAGESAGNRRRHRARDGRPESTRKRSIRAAVRLTSTQGRTETDPNHRGCTPQSQNIRDTSLRVRRKNSRRSNRTEFVGPSRCCRSRSASSCQSESRTRPLRELDSLTAPIADRPRRAQLCTLSVPRKWAPPSPRTSPRRRCVECQQRQRTRQQLLDRLRRCRLKSTAHMPPWPTRKCSQRATSRTRPNARGSSVSTANPAVRALERALTARALHEWKSCAIVVDRAALCSSTELLPAQFDTRRKSLPRQHE